MSQSKQSLSSMAKRHQKVLENKLRRALSPFQKFIQEQVAASCLLLIATISAIVWASSASNEYYQQFTQIMLGLHISKYIFDHSLQFWVNDILLTLFFFFVGLEIKREFLVGELRNHKRTSLIVMAALGGMVVPASIYFLLNINSGFEAGWGIPMATDTAFALGILTLFRHRLPAGVFTFLAALAIVDDIGAIIVIAVFYTTNINMDYFYIALGFLAVMALANFVGIRRPLPYIFVGLLVWFFIEEAGIHGTISGILIAFIIPAHSEKGPKQFIKKTKKLLRFFEAGKEGKHGVLKDAKQFALLKEVEENAIQTTTPLQRWQDKLELPIALIILPLFAFVNAGVPIDIDLIKKTVTHPVALGVILGLVIGKPLGITLFSYIGYKLKLGLFPKGVNFKQVFSISLLTGIGFTMSIFVAGISFYDNSEIELLAKAAIMLASIFAGVLGVFTIMISNRYQTKNREISSAETLK